jgi:hypothetical protein
MKLRMVASPLPGMRNGRDLQAVVMSPKRLGYHVQLLALVHHRPLRAYIPLQIYIPNNIRLINGN